MKFLGKMFWSVRLWATPEVVTIDWQLKPVRLERSYTVS